MSVYPWIKIIEPQSYLDMVRLLDGCRLVLMDSGGLQKEAYILKKPYVTLHDTTEWIETADEGWNILAGANKKEIIKGVKALDGHCGSHRQWYGDGNAAESIVEIIKNFLVK